MRDYLRRETLETSTMTDREILAEIYDIVAEMNGSVRTLNAELYGDANHGSDGLKKEVDKIGFKVDCLEDGVGGLKVAMKIAWSIVGTIGIGVLTVLSILVGTG